MHVSILALLSLRLEDRLLTFEWSGLIAAAYPWYYIVDSTEDGGRVVKDIWVPWKGW
jgi:hypothetical protein